MRDLSSNLKVVQSIDAKVYTADENGVGVDLRGFDGAMVSVNFGITGDTLSGSVFADIELEESDDNSTFTDVADADLIGKQSGLPAGVAIRVDDAAEDEQSYQFGYIGSKRYIRPVLNLTGTHTNGIEVAVDVVKGFPHRSPAA